MINNKRTTNNDQRTTKNALFLNIESMKKAFISHRSGQLQLLRFPSQFMLNVYGHLGKLGKLLGKPRTALR